MSTVAKRRFFAPEVVQTSSIDCGPACLKSAFAGFDIEVGYDALRDGCQTSVDGTSIDALERVANELGLVAEQIWVPVDHLTIPEISPLPAILVAQQPGGTAHFLLAWRKAFGLFQVMDPAMGRRWVSAVQLAAMNFPYELDIDAEIWRGWARTPELAHALGVRLARVNGDVALIAAANADESAISISCLDAATRMVDDLVRAGAVRNGDESRAVLTSLYQRAVLEHNEGTPGKTIPETFFSALPQPGEMIRLRGAILLRLRGRAQTVVTPEGGLVLPAAVAERVRREPRRRPWAEAFAVLRREGVLAPSLIFGATITAALLAFLEVIMLRALLDIGSRLQGMGQRLGAFASLLFFLVLATAFELWSIRGVRALGRRFELRLRTDFLAKIPLLGDVYFRSRPASDMAHRAHSFHPVRNVPLVGGRILRLIATLVVTLAGLVWLDPAGWKNASLCALVCVIVPWVGQGLLTESDLKVRVHDGRLAQFALDALLGLMPIRAHGAERAVRWVHASIVLEWARACKERLRRTVMTDVVQTIATYALAIAVVVGYVRRAPEPGAVLLLAYWVLGLPVIGQEIAFLARQIPRQRNLLGRLLDPIRADTSVPSNDAALRTAQAAAPEAHAPPGPHEEEPPRSLSTVEAKSIQLDGVSVVLGGRAVLEHVSLDISAGEHVAIVGPSGAGKSTLLGLLLGFAQADHGRITVDGAPLDVEHLRRHLAWVDPTVTLWSGSLIENVRFGREQATDLAVSPILERAELLEVLERMPDGLQTALGEGGRLVSGGEGQRVRIARAMMRKDAGLVLLDEPFRGLERSMRSTLLDRTRAWWMRSTLLCVTHDVGSALDFDRVVVVDGGTIVEQGRPSDLLAQRAGRFYELFEAEKRLHERGWHASAWRKLRVEDGVVNEAEAAE